MAPTSATIVLVPVVLVKLCEALLVARVDAVHKPSTHQHLRAILDETSLQLGKFKAKDRNRDGESIKIAAPVV